MESKNRKMHAELTNSSLQSFKVNTPQKPKISEADDLVEIHENDGENAGSRLPPNIKKTKTVVLEKPGYSKRNLKVPKHVKSGKLP